MLSNAIQEKMHKRLKGMELWYEVVVSKKNDRMTDKLANMLLVMVNRRANNPNVVRLTYIEDMEAYAMMMLCRTWSKFDTDRFTNAYAYYTTCIHGSFCQFINKEKKEQDIKEDLKNMVDEEQHF